MSTTTFSGPVVSNNGFTGDVTGDVAGVITLTSVTTDNLPAAASSTGQLYVISDNGAGDDEFALVVSDGTDWVKVTTTALT